MLGRKPALAQETVYLCWRVKTRAFSRHTFVSAGYVKVWKGNVIQEWICPTKSLIHSLRYSNLNVSREQLPLQTHTEKQALLCPITCHNPCLCGDKLLSPKGPLFWIRCVMCIFQKYYLRAEVFLCFLPSFSLEILKMFSR